ncbi:MAG: poly(R)-hydroxyalkanoic acid synthase subunit PhaE [Chloroflexota bacterium]
MTETQQSTTFWHTFYATVLGEAPTLTANTPLGPSASLEDMRVRWTRRLLESTSFDASDATKKHVAEKIITSQLTALRLIETASETWQAIEPYVLDGDKWELLLMQTIQHIRQRMEAPILTHQSQLRNSETRYQAYLDNLRHQGAIWQNLQSLYMTAHNPLMGIDNATLIETSSLHSDIFGNSFASLLNGQGMTNTKALQATIERDFEAWFTLQRANHEYQLLIIDQWLCAFEDLMRQCVGLVQAGEALDSLQAFLNRWSQLADRVFKETFRSPEYVQLQRQLVDAVMHHRETQQLLGEALLSAYGVPTRREMDEAHRRIHDLRKQVQQLQRAVTMMQAQSDSAEGA